MLVLACVVCDLVDGAVARRFGASRWGATLDSAADAISFGAVPAMLVLSQAEGSAIPTAYRLAALVFGIGAMLRLVRFARRPRRAGAFEGLPTTMAAVNVVAVMQLHLPDVPMFAAVLLIAGLMVSRLPFPALRGTSVAVASLAVLLSVKILLPAAVHHPLPTAVRACALLVIAVVCGAPLWSLCARRRKP